MQADKERGGQAFQQVRQRLHALKTGKTEPAPEALQGLQVGCPQLDRWACPKCGTDHTWGWHVVHASLVCVSS